MEQQQENTQETAPKTWREKIAEYNRKNRFQFVGWNPQGVPKWRGGWTKGPPLWFCRIFLTLGISLLTMGILTGLFASGKGAGEARWALALIGTIHSIVAALMYRHVGKLQPLLPAEAVSERLGVDAETMQGVAEERNIKPRVIINDEPMYNLQDFGDVGILLRASEAPILPETLLRASSPVIPIIPQEELLRAAATESAQPVAARSSAEEQGQRVAITGAQE